MVLQVTVVYAPAARQVFETTLQLPDGSTVDDALQASGLTKTFGELTQAPWRVGVWYREVGLDRTLQDQDRVEVYRPLTLDPKLARRARYATQGGY